MNRRQAIQNVALLVGGTLSSSTLMALFTSCNPSGTVQNDPSGGLFSNDLKVLLDEITETILPKTGSPGAKEAKVGDFIQLMIHDCYSKVDQELFLRGLDKFQMDCKASTQKSFVDLSVPDREKYLLSIEKDLFKKKETENNKISDDHTLVAKKKVEGKQIDAVNKEQVPGPEEPNHYYRILKELTLLGYFTSEPGATKALEYVKVPTKFIGTMPLKPGQKAWATS